MKKLYRYLFTHMKAASIIISIACLLSGVMILSLAIKLHGSDLSMLLFPVGVLLLLDSAVIARLPNKLKKRPTSTTNVAVAILLSVALAAQPLSASEIPEPERDPDERVTLVVALVGAACCVAVGYAVYKIWKLADKYCPKPTKPPPPPPTVATNAPRAALTMPLMGTFTTTNQSIWDVSAFATNAMWLDPDGNRFNYFFTNRVEAFTDANFSSAEPITIFGWISTNWLETVLYRGQDMRPVVTNLAPLEVVPVLQSGLPLSPAYFIK